MINTLYEGGGFGSKFDSGFKSVINVEHFISMGINFGEDGKEQD